MTLLYRVPRDGALFCKDCLTGDQMATAVMLDPALFPGTYALLCCSACAASAGEQAVVGGEVVPGSTVRALPTQGGDLLDEVQAAASRSVREGPQDESR